MGQPHWTESFVRRIHEENTIVNALKIIRRVNLVTLQTQLIQRASWTHQRYPHKLHRNLEKPTAMCARTPTCISTKPALLDYYLFSNQSIHDVRPLTYEVQATLHACMDVLFSDTSLIVAPPPGGNEHLPMVVTPPLKNPLFRPRLGFLFVEKPISVVV